MKYIFFVPGRSTTIKLHWRRTLLLFVLYSAMQSAIAQDSLPVAKQKDTLPQPPRRQTPLTQKDFTLLKEYPVLWQQTAAEYRALCYQAFNIALLRINEIPRKQFKKQKLAIITDLDETILDNSYSEAQLIKEGKNFSMKSWKEWVNKSAATGVPGAVEFLQAASKKGISIFYVSNRDQLDVKSTLINLQKLELPNADTAHMLFLVDSSSKESRRQLLAAQYNVVMLLGDNLNDFMNVFESKNIAGRFAETDKQKDEWGKKFIVLPNATYGEWESALTNYLKGLKPEQKEAMRRALLKGFN